MAPYRPRHDHHHCVVHLRFMGRGADFGSEAPLPRIAHAPEWALDLSHP